MNFTPYNLSQDIGLAAFGLFSLLAFSANTMDECRAQTVAQSTANDGTAVGSNDASADVSAQWQKQNPQGANAEFRMPTQPRAMERSFKPVADRPQIVVKLQLSSIDQGQIVFVFSYHDLHDMPENRRKVNEILDGAVKGTVARVIGQLNSDQTVSLREYPGRKISYDFTQNGQGLKSDSEIYLIGKRQYVLNAIFKDSNYDAALSQKFFDSFNPFNPEETVAMDDPVDAPPLGNNGSFEISPDQLPVELK